MQNDLITQCRRCGTVWVAYSGNSNGSAKSFEFKPGCIEETIFFNELEILAYTIRRLNLSPEQLAKKQLKINHGACRLCLREALINIERAKQKREGNPDCFAKADNGYCDQNNCKFRSFCIVKPAELERWRKEMMDMYFPPQ